MSVTVKVVFYDKPGEEFDLAVYEFLKPHLASGATVGYPAASDAATFSLYREWDTEENANAFIQFLQQYPDKVVSAAIE
jgi:hypothetical protein